MTVASVIADAIVLLNAQVPTLTSVEESDADLPPVRPNQMPAVRLKDRNWGEGQLSGGVGGYRNTNWILDNHVFIKSGDNATDIAAFHTMVESIEDAYRKHDRLNGGADVSGKSQLLSVARTGNSGNPRPLSKIPYVRRSNAGVVVRYTVISVQINEIYSG